MFFSRADGVQHGRRIDFPSGSLFRGRGFWVDSDCLRLAKSISIVFQRGGCKPEVVFPSGSRCIRRVFLMDSDCLRVSQSTLGRWTHREPLRKTTSGLLPPRRKTLRIDWPNLKQSELIEKPRPTYREPLRNFTFFHKSPRWQTVENDWTNLT